MVEGGAATADTPEEELHVLLKDRLALNTTIIEITDFLVSEVRARVELLCPHDIVASRDGWPLYWRCHRSDRGEFLADLRRFAGNDATQFGTLLTPLVNGLRVRGPFHPDLGGGDPLRDADRPGRPRPHPRLGVLPAVVDHPDAGRGRHDRAGRQRPAADAGGTGGRHAPDRRRRLRRQAGALLHPLRDGARARTCPTPTPAATT